MARVQGELFGDSLEHALQTTCFQAALEGSWYVADFAVFSVQMLIG